MTGQPLTERIASPTPPLTRRDVQDYLDENFPELKCQVGGTDIEVNVQITYGIGFKIGYCESNMWQIKLMLLNSLYAAVGNLTVLTCKVRDEING